VKREGRAVDVGGEHDAVIADAHFDDVGHAVLGAGRDLAVADRARGVRDVDGVLADAFAERRRPVDEPPDSTTGVGKSKFSPKASATMEA
jgi:hypothetical protein